METLDFVIYPDGRVKEMVTVIMGTSSAGVTAAIEVQLGDVVAHQKSSEYYAQPVQVESANRTSLPAQVLGSRW